MEELIKMCAKLNYAFNIVPRPLNYSYMCCALMQIVSAKRKPNAQSAIIIS